MCTQLVQLRPEDAKYSTKDVTIKASVTLFWRNLIFWEYLSNIWDKYHNILSLVRVSLKFSHINQSYLLSVPRTFWPADWFHFIFASSAQVLYRNLVQKKWQQAGEKKESNQQRQQKRKWHKKRPNRATSIVKRAAHHRPLSLFFGRAPYLSWIENKNTAEQKPQQKCEKNKSRMMRLTDAEGLLASKNLNHSKNNTHHLE